jgi:hypothetical protein
MSLKRGGFRLICDARGCDAYVDLETDDFEDAKELKQAVENEDGWRAWGPHSNYVNTCPIHTSSDCNIQIGRFGRLEEQMPKDKRPKNTDIERLEPIEGTIELGDYARATITGFEGVVVGHVRYLQGCDQFCLQPQGTQENGKPYDSYYFDAPYVDLLEKQRVPDRTPGRTEGPDKAPPSRL